MVVKRFNRETEEVLEAAEEGLRALCRTRADYRLATAAARLSGWVEAAASANVEGEAGTAADLARLRALSRDEPLDKALRAAANVSKAFAWAVEHPEIALEPEGVQRLHGITMRDLLPPEKVGRWRENDVDLLNAAGKVINTGQDPEDLPELMARWSSLYARPAEGHVVRTAARSHLAFEFIHPFPDGNGRVGRALIAGVHAAADLPPVPISKIISEHRADYAAAFEAAQKADSPEPYVRFHAEATFHAARHAMDLARAIEGTRSQFKAWGASPFVAGRLSSKPLVTARDIGSAIGVAGSDAEVEGKRAAEGMVRAGLLIHRDGCPYGVAPLLRALLQPYRYRAADPGDAPAPEIAPTYPSSSP